MDDRNPPTVIGNQEKGELYVWIGALSGWLFLRDGSMMHRCGFKVTADRYGTYFGNFVMETVATHRCLDWIEYHRQERDRIRHRRRRRRETIALLFGRWRKG